MRVLIVCYEFPPVGGGTGVACEAVVRELAGEGDVSLDVLTSGPGESTLVDRPADNLEIHRLPVGKRDLHYWRPGELARWLAGARHHGRRLAREREYDLTHCWAGWPSGLVGHGMRRSIPYVVSLRGSDVPGYNARLRWLDPLVFRHVVRRVWRDAAAVVSVSGNLRDLALQTTNRVPIEVIRNGVDVERFTPRDDGSPSPFTVLFVGRLIPRKGARHLVDAFAEIVGAGETEARLVLAGDGPERDVLEAQCRRSGISDRVEFHGIVPRTGMPALLREASVLVLPAYEEAMPNAVLEAMASGLAIVTTPTGARELLDGNGFVVERGASAPLREALGRYLADPELLAAHRARSREIARSLSWSRVAHRYEELYERVLRETRG
jgi:glycosyltransferase involved in cell wall biosynthesis